MSVILSNVISPTGGMVMSFSSAVFAIHVTNVFNMLFPCIQVFSQTSVTGQQLALWLLTDLLFSLFGGSYITPFRWVLLF